MIVRVIEKVTETFFYIFGMWKFIIKILGMHAFLFRSVSLKQYLRQLYFCIKR